MRGRASSQGCLVRTQRRHAPAAISLRLLFFDHRLKHILEPWTLDVGLEFRIMPKTFADLVALMDRLRSPEGCPWDREQTYTTLAPMLLEEANEAFEAVEDAVAGRPAGLRDELGDMLFQIVFYAQVAKERGDFSIDDVTEAVHSKMVRRHPHVFGDAQAENATAVLRNWEAIKAEEKRAAGDAATKDASILDGVSAQAPALMEAHQLSTKAARVGFDWQRTEDIFDKIQEEVDELRVAIKAHEESKAEADHAHVREEIGDLLFVVTNIARRLQVEPEAALKFTNKKFRRRFAYIEESLRTGQESFETVTIEELEAFWQEAKRLRR
jgi:tetrapyrrole methylase family protein/MazG family protein